MSIYLILNMNMNIKYSEITNAIKLVSNKSLATLKFVSNDVHFDFSLTLKPILICQGFLALKAIFEELDPKSPLLNDACIIKNLKRMPRRSNKEIISHPSSKEKYQGYSKRWRLALKFKMVSLMLYYQIQNKLYIKPESNTQ